MRLIAAIYKGVRTLLAGALEDHAIVLLTEPETGCSKFIKLGANRRDDPRCLARRYMPGVRITFAPAVAASLTPAASSINKASETSSVASTIASLSPGSRSAWRRRSTSATLATARTDSHEVIAARTHAAAGYAAPPTTTSLKTACGIAILPKTRGRKSKPPRAAR